ncbi:MAG: 2-oxo acid dehydrogenase subunit E2 [Eubacteriaceae bacterium]|nr:2-oxo acid dehydrogenase subunit E2 [Eubacteriaceae bacterium]
MADYILMPKLGLTMTEGNISNWRKSEGDSVSNGEILFDVETDKLTNEFEATSSGVLRKIIVSEGTVGVLKPIAIVGTVDEDISSLLAQIGGGEEMKAEAESKTEVKIAAEVKSENKGGRIKASPRAKKLAQELNVDLSDVTGTGPQGSVSEKDVTDFAEKSKEAKKKISPAAAVIAEGLNVDIGKIEKDSRIMKEDVYKFKMNDDLLKFAAPQEQRKPMSQMRQVIAKRMSESQQISPTVNYNQRVDTTNMKLLREQLKDTMKVTYTDILVKVLSKVLLEFPLLNSSLDGNEIILRNYASIGVAVALTDGLIVPVVKYANVKGLKDISVDIKNLAAKAKNNELQGDDITGGTFTITNIGMYGMESFTPIINQPQVAILGINTIQDTPMAVDGQVVIKPMMNLSLTADHRVVDGSVAAQFMAKLKGYIENPGLLLL